MLRRLDEALAFLALEFVSQLDLDQWHGFEAHADALQRHGLVERSIACSFYPASLRELRRCEPGLRTGISIRWTDGGWRGGGTLSGDPGRGGRAACSASPSHRAYGQSGGSRVGDAPPSRALARDGERCHGLGVSVFAGRWTTRSCSPESSRPAWTG